METAAILVINKFNKGTEVLVINFKQSNLKAVHLYENTNNFINKNR